MHAVAQLIAQAVEAGLNFNILVGGSRETRLKMGMPASVVDRQPLLLTFPASYHRYSDPRVDDDGLHCLLSFDALYHCRIPWSTIRHIIFENPGDDSWPEKWEDPAARAAKSGEADGEKKKRTRGAKAAVGDPTEATGEPAKKPKRTARTRKSDAVVEEAPAQEPTEQPSSPDAPPPLPDNVRLFRPRNRK